MRIKDVNLGGGLFRLDTEPTHWGEDVNNVPTHVMDDIMRDVVKRMKEEKGPQPEWKKHWHNLNESKPAQDFVAPLPFDGAEDGIDIHVDRPRREMYGGWDADYGFRKDMKAYNNLKAAAKECNWPCREPMRGLPQEAPVQQPIAQPESSCSVAFKLPDVLQEVVGLLNELMW